MIIAIGVYTCQGGAQIRTLSSTLTTAQQTGGKELKKIVLTKTGQTTRTYDNDSTTNRILSISHEEQIWSYTAEVVIDNRDGNLDSLDLRGYKGVISNGFNTSAGDEYSAKAPLTVAAQRIETWGGDAVCVLSLASKINQMEQDKASADYQPDSSNTDTVSTIITALVNATLTAFNHCENLTIGGTIDGDKDPVIDSFKPADFFRVYYGESRRTKVEELFSYTFDAFRITANGSLTWVQFANGHAKKWAANTVIRLGETVKPTTANGHIYTCTTAGTTHATTEPTWPTTEGNTVADNSVVWTLDYDYQYARGSSAHNFIRKGLRLALVAPNKITIESDPSHSPSYTGTATDTDSNDLQNFPDRLRLRLASDSEATDIAKANLGHHQINTDIGFVIAPINVGIELYDLVRVYDSADDVSLIGNVMVIQDFYTPGQSYQVLRFGLKTTSLLTRPPVFSFPERRDSSPATYANIIDLQTFVIERDLTLLKLIGKAIQTDRATVTQLNAGTDALRVITPDVLAGSNLGTTGIGVIAVDFTTAITVADGKAYIPIPAFLNGMNLIRAQAMVITAGTTNATTIDIYNVTDSVDMLSTAISIASGATVGTVGTIDATKDDVATNDVLRVDVTTVSTTAPQGLLVVLEFRLP